MPKQINSSLNEVRVPFAKMSFTPDVPSAALGPNEFNAGLNVETDVRGIRSVSGDQNILAQATPGTPTYISSGFRQDGRFWTIIAQEDGKWYAARNYLWYDITPVNGAGTYTQGQNITESWSGTVPFFNDAQNPPMFWPEDTAYRIVTTSATSGSGTATLGFAQQTPLATVTITNTEGKFSYSSGEQLKVNQKVTVSGAITTPVVVPTATISGVKITGIAGQFSCTSTQLSVGQTVTISGTLGGTGTITGYTNPTTYRISATNGTTTFTLVTAAGVAIVTTAGTPTGLTYTIGVGIVNTAGLFACAATTLLVGQQVIVSGTLSGTGTITAYSDPTTYVIATTNGSTLFTLKTTGGAAIVTTVGSTTGLTFSIQPPAITGYVTPTTYFIIATNGFNEFTLSTTLGGTAVTTLPGATTGLTFVYFPFYVGQTIAVSTIVPAQYQGTYVVTASTTTSVSYALTGTWGAQTTAGTVGPELPRMIMYSNQIPMGISNITYISNTEYQITLDQTQPSAPFTAGENIQIANVNNYFNGVFEVVSATTSTINFNAPNGIGTVYPGNSIGTVAPEYSWNYNPNWSAVHAGWMRLYNTPNVGSILVAGNLTATNKTTGQTEEYPVTVQWSQNFGLETAPLTWTPTILNVANQLEVPLRGASLDAFPCNGQLFLCSYWDTVVFSPINYTTTNAPILGVRLFNQGRGLLSANCFANTDKVIYGIDARDVWAFDGTQFVGLGNQRVKNWFFNQIDQRYTDRIYMQANTQRNQIEIYYPTVDAAAYNNLSGVAIAGTAGQFSCNATTLVLGQAITISGTLSGSGSITGYTSPTTYYIIATNGSTTFTLSATANGSAITTTAGTTTGLTVAITTYGVPNKMISYRYDLDCWNAPRDVTAATAAAESPVRFYSPTTGTWLYRPASRTVIYARGESAQKIVQKDQGYAFLSTTENPDGLISSYFERDNLKLLNDYSGKLLVHRILPEFVNLNNNEVPISAASFTTLTASTDGTYNTVTFAEQESAPFNSGDTILIENVSPNGFNGVKTVTTCTTTSVSWLGTTAGPQTLSGTVSTNLIGDLSVTLKGANSVGQAPASVNTGVISSDTEYPWMQYNQNAYRVNSVNMSNSSNQQIWMVTGITWQYTQVEDDR